MAGVAGGRNILVIKLGALGDVMLSMPQLARILEAHSADRIMLLTAHEYSDLFTGFPCLEVVAFRRRGFVEMLRVLYWLIGHHFDIVYDLQGSLRSRVMTLVTQARLRAGITSGLAYTHTPAHGSTPRYAFDRFNAVLTAAGLDAALPEPCLPATAEAEQAVSDWLQQHRLEQKRLVLMHAGSSRRWPAKRWPEAGFLALAQALEQCGLTVVWVGGEDERDVNRCLAKVVGVDATAAFSYAELAALGRHAVFAVTNDSGPMHVLAASRLPVYAFFGPTDWQRSHALGQESRVLVNPVPCSPCHLPVCPPERQHICLQGITSGEVLERLQRDGLL